MAGMKLHMKVAIVLALIGAVAASGRGGDAETGIARASHAARHAVEDWIKLDGHKRPAFAEQPFAATSLTRADADAIRKLLWADRKRTVRAERAGEWRERKVRIGSSEMRFDVRTFGAKPLNGHSLYLSLHGGGSTPARVNDRQWENQKRLYTPKEGLYIAPRAPIDSWDMWHRH